MGSKKRFLAVAVSAVAVMGLGSSAAFAGDITGKPGGSKYIAGSDAAPLNGRSDCAYSGLNDEYYIDGEDGAPRVQTPKDGPFAGVAGYACNPVGMRSGPKA